MPHDAQEGQTPAEVAHEDVQDIFNEEAAPYGAEYGNTVISLDSSS